MQQKSVLGGRMISQQLALINCLFVCASISKFGQKADPQIIQFESNSCEIINDNTMTIFETSFL